MVYKLIWDASLILAALSVSIMFVLIFRRAYIQTKKRKRDKRKSFLKPYLFQLIFNLEGLNDFKKITKKSDHYLIINIARNLLETVRGEMRENLITVLRQYDAIEIDLDKLQNGIRSERAEAAINLSTFYPDEVEEHLRKALADPAPEVRMAAANSMIKLGLEVSAIQLAQSFIEDGLVSPRGMRDLFRKVAPQSVKEFLSVLGDENEDLVVLVVDALSQAQDLTMIPHIIKLVKEHPSKDVRAVAIRTLTSLRHPRAQTAIRDALYDHNWEVRAQAAIAAGLIGLENVEDRLNALLSDPQWWVRFRSAQALCKLGEKGNKIINTAIIKGGEEGEIALLVKMESKGV